MLFVVFMIPKGIMRSAVPLPCFFDVVKSQKVAGQRPRQETKTCRMGKNSVRPSIPPPISPCICPWGLRASQRGLRASWWGLMACKRGLKACHWGLRACKRGPRARRPTRGALGPATGAWGRATGAWTLVRRGLNAYQKGPEGLPQGLEGLPRGPEAGIDAQTYRLFLPILQDFVPCRSRCPKTNKS